MATPLENIVSPASGDQAGPGPTPPGFDGFPLKVVLCGACNRTNWTIGHDGMLLCDACGFGFRFRGSILDCRLSASANSNPVIDEWDSYYGKNAGRYSASKDWWTVSSWKKHLFAWILRDLPGKFVVDMGCAAATRVATIAPIRHYGYHYLGIDSSLDALQQASKNMPEGYFIRANLASLELQAEIADIVLCLGILMYFEDDAEILERLLSILKPGAVLLLHELVRRKPWGRLARPLFPIPRDVFPNANVYGVSQRNLLNQLAARGEILHVHRGGSPWRQLMRRLLDDSPLEGLRPLAALADSLWCATLGRVWPAVGAAEIQIVFRKA